MKSLKVAEVRETFLQFFESKGCSFLLLFGLPPIGNELSIGVGEVDFTALALRR
jgi:hypothetical protein